jgi:hypothetical protein
MSHILGFSNNIILLVCKQHWPFGVFNGYDMKHIFGIEWLNFVNSENVQAFIGACVCSKCEQCAFMFKLFCVQFTGIHDQKGLLKKKFRLRDDYIGHETLDVVHLMLENETEFEVLLFFFSLSFVWSEIIELTCPFLSFYC